MLNVKSTFGDRSIPILNSTLYEFQNKCHSPNVRSRHIYIYAWSGGRDSVGQWMRASSSMSLDTSSTDMCFCSASSRPCTSCMPCGKGACVCTHVHGDRRREEVTQSKCLHSTPTLMAHLTLTPPPPHPHLHSCCNCLHLVAWKVQELLQEVTVNEACSWFAAVLIGKGTPAVNTRQGSAHTVTRKYVVASQKQSTSCPVSHVTDM